MAPKRRKRRNRRLEQACGFALILLLVLALEIGIVTAAFAWFFDQGVWFNT